MLSYLIYLIAIIAFAAVFISAAVIAVWPYEAETKVNRDLPDDPNQLIDMLYDGRVG